MRRAYLPFLAVLAVGCAKDTERALPTPTLLSAAGANHVMPAYSPDGSRVAGWQGVGTGVQLWLADGDLGNLTLQPLRSPGVRSPLWSPDGSRVATSQSNATTFSIVVFPASGGDMATVHSGSGWMYPMSWRADGTQILLLTTDADGGSFTSVVLDPATGTAEPLLPGERRTHLAFFAPVGQHAVVMTYDSARTMLWALDSLGATPRQLTSEGYEVVGAGGAAAWSPDGRTLVYESSRTGAPDLWVLDFASGEARQLTSDLRADRSAAWSPDGKWILFQSERGRQSDLWVVPATGGDAIRLTDDAAVESVVGWRGASLQVAYTVAGGVGTVHAIPITGGAERQLTPDSVTVDYFEASPDGSQMAFTSRRTGGVGDIWVMPSAGGAARLLASPMMDLSRVLWSPDGTHLLFTGTGGGTQDPWIVEVATGALRQVLTWDSWEGDAVWGRDATELFVISDRDSPLSDLWRVPLDGGEPVRLTTAGRINGVFPTKGTPRLLVTLLSSEGGRIGLGEVMPDGAIRMITNAQTVWSVAWNTPAGSDSIAVLVTGDGGTISSVMMSLADGGTRPLGPPGARVNYWSRTGAFLSYSIATAQGSAVGVVERASGTARTVTPGIGFEAGAEFLPGDSVLVFRRNRPENRLAVLDLTDMLSRMP